MTGMAVAHCILGKFLGVVCHCFPPPLDARNDARDPSSERWNWGREISPVVILPKFRLPRKFRDLLHAANLRHGTDGFTFPPKETRTHNQYGDTIEKSQAPDDGCINDRNMLSIVEVK